MQPGVGTHDGNFILDSSITFAGANDATGLLTAIDFSFRVVA